MEYFAQTNVFARIRTVFAHLIIGCVIQYPKTGNLRYRALAAHQWVEDEIAEEVESTT